jgi:integral membrane protein (TIGR01906 family)
MDRLRGGLAALVTGVALALVLVAVAMIPFLTPAWVGFAQARAEAEAWTGFTTAELAVVTGEVLSDLVLGPPDFDVVLRGEPVLTDSERGHMRDVRGVFAAFYAAALVAFAVLVALWVAARGAVARRRFWRRVAGSGAVIAGVVVVGGIAGVALFDQAFALFHQVFFPGGNWQFDPRTDRLVQLFPQAFWVDSTIGVGGAVVVLALLATAVGWWRARSLEARAGVAAALDARPVAAR